MSLHFFFFRHLLPPPPSPFIFFPSPLPLIVHSLLGDTDFRVYYHHLSRHGVDFAFIDNGYVYHSYRDSPSQIPSGSLQFLLDNTLSLSLHLVQLDPSSFTSHDPSLRQFDPAIDLLDQKVGRPNDDTFYTSFLGLYQLVVPSSLSSVFDRTVLLLFVFYAVNLFIRTPLPVKLTLAFTFVLFLTLLLGVALSAGFSYLLHLLSPYGFQIPFLAPCLIS